MTAMFRDLHIFADGTEIAQSCRIRLTARETLSLLPQLFSLEIENLSGSSAALLSAARAVEARSEGSVLASGEILALCPERRNGREILSVSFSPDYSFRKSAVSLSLSAGMKVSDTVRAVLAAAGPSVPLAAFSADDLRLTRPQSFFGRTCDALRILADTVGADAYLAPAGLCVVSRSPRTPSLILPEESLLSAPVFLPDRVLLSTSVTGWPLGCGLRFTWQGTARQGRLVSRLIQLDTAEGPWLSRLEVVL